MAAGTHARVARQGTADMLDPLLQGERITPFIELVGEIADQRFDIEPGNQRRHLADDNRTRPKWLQYEAELRQLVSPGRDAGRKGRVELDDFRQQEDLPCDAVAGERRLHPLIDEALMGS